MSRPAFQGRDSGAVLRAFGIAFQDYTRRPYIYTTISREAIHIEVTTSMQNIAPGAAVYIQVKVKDANQTTEQLFNPDTSMQIELYNPAGTTLVAFAAGAMTNETTGQYGYNYQTTTGSPVGLYTAKFKAVNGSVTGLTHPIGVFVVRAE